MISRVFIPALLLSGFIGGSVSAKCRLSAQTAASSASPAAFDAATIKPSTGDGPAILRPLKDGIRAKNVSFLDIFRAAYGDARLLDDMISGLPDWARSERYDVEAKISESDAALMLKMDSTQRDTANNLLLQRLLMDRLNLKVHAETKEVKALGLVFVKTAQRLHADADYDTSLPGTIRMSPGSMDSHGISMERFVKVLSEYLKCPVADQTGLTGRYTFVLDWPVDAPESQTFDLNAVLVPAVNRELGLKLINTKAPTQVFVIDHIERPSPN